MLKHLAIRNYALIDNVDLELPDGLTILTGETGAGKSILLGALSLIAGERADSSVIFDRSKKCIVEGVFDLKGLDMQEFFTRNELDYSETSTLRREISPEGKSRSFINDTPVNLSQLRELSLRLIDIHSQHETLKLNEAAFQLAMVDAYSGIAEQMAEYRIEFRKLRSAETRLADLLEQERKAKQDADYWRFQLDELEELKLVEGEQEKSETELKTLENADEIRSVLEHVQAALDGGETDLISGLSECRSKLNSIGRLDTVYQELVSRMQSNLIELKDLASDIRRLAEKVHSDPMKVESLSRRLDSIYRLQQKHQLNSVEDLLRLQASISDKMQSGDQLSAEIASLRKVTEKLREAMFKQARNISSKRIRSLSGLEKEVRKLLESLAMPQARFKAEHSLLEQLTDTGIDKIRFLFSANKGAELRDISKVASGGELSRLMLALKSLVAQRTALPTVVFDEIDTGVSGVVAEQVGKLIEGMGAAMQVISITHLPQIASKGDSHIVVYKEDRNGRTRTYLKTLKQQDRVAEIAKMLSSGPPTEASLRNARELLRSV